MIPHDVLIRLRCPRCRGQIAFDGADGTCPSGHVFPLRHGFLEALPSSSDDDTQRTLASFGFEWTTFDAINPQDRHFWNTYFADVTVDELRDKVGLDAGCGNGRFAYFTAPYLKTLVALDGSEAVRSAVRNLSGFSNVAVLRADVRDAPLVDESFDFIYCLGVLHHLTDPQAGFQELLRLLAPGGSLLIYVYSRPETFGVRATALAAAAKLRRLTVHTPARILRWISAVIGAALYAGFVLPGWIGDRLGSKRLSGFPMRAYRRKAFRSLWLDTFDRLSAPLEERYIWQEIEPWFADAGLKVVKVRENAGLFVLARKPEPLFGASSVDRKQSLTEESGRG